MDDLFIYLVLGIVYLIFQALTSGKKKKARPKVPSTDSSVPNDRPALRSSGEEPTLDDALREIRIALGMEAPPAPKPPPVAQTSTRKPPPPPAPRKTKPVRTHSPELAETAPAKSWPSEFKQIETHYADETFEELPPTIDGDRFGQQRLRAKPRKAPKKKPVIAVPQTAKKTTQATWAHRLQDPGSARTAFVMSEIFGPPRAMKQR